MGSTIVANLPCYATAGTVAQVTVLCAALAGCASGDTAGPKPETVPVFAVEVSPKSDTISAGATLIMHVVEKDAAGNVLPPRAVSWSTSNIAIAKVDAAGLVLGVADGVVIITATSEGKSDTADISVLSPGGAVATISIDPNEATLGISQVYQLSATPRDISTNELQGRSVIWTSSNPAAASVSASGAVTALAIGNTQITATSEGKGTTAALTIVDAPQPRQFVALNVAFHTVCAYDASGAAFCWGDGADGQIGNGNTKSATFPLPVSGSFNFSTLHPGWFHSCGLTMAGVAYCWGRNNTGDIGDGTNAQRLNPVPVSGGLAFTQIGTGFGATCGLTVAGAAYCWGQNPFGELGDGTSSDRLVPVAVAGGKTFSSLTVGFGHACALTSGGVAYCWGDNRSGALADGTTTNSNVPILVSGSIAFSSLTAGELSTCGLTSSGAAYCWGYNFAGQLGNGTTSDQRAPAAVDGGLTFKSLTIGSGHACGITPGGDAYCWGLNTSGQLGNGTLAYSLVPVPVSGGLKFESISAGSRLTCGMTPSNVAYCWGMTIAVGSANVPQKVFGQP